MIILKVQRKLNQKKNLKIKLHHKMDQIYNNKINN